MEWLKELEDQVRRATGEIAALRKQNRSLTSRVKRLKREAQSTDEAAAGDWEDERAEIRRRAEQIAATLETLLSDS